MLNLERSLRIRYEDAVGGDPCAADLLGRYNDPFAGSLRLPRGGLLPVSCHEIRIGRSVGLPGIYRTVCRLCRGRRGS